VNNPATESNITNARGIYIPFQIAVSLWFGNFTLVGLNFQPLCDLAATQVYALTQKCRCTNIVTCSAINDPNAKGEKSNKDNITFQGYCGYKFFTHKSIEADQYN